MLQEKYPLKKMKNSLYPDVFLNKSKAVEKEAIAFDYLRDFINSYIGLRLDENRQYILKSKIDKILIREKIDSITTLANYINLNNTKWINILVQNITTGHTFFCREEHHLKYLLNHVKNKKPDSFMKIWSAGCSTGEEVYSIIISLLSEGISNFLVVASDISTSSLQKASFGIYHKDKVKRFSKDIIRKYFSEYNDQYYQVTKAVRRHAKIKQINMIEPVQFQEYFDVVFCRNILMYFDERGLTAAYRNIISNLKPEGLLFTGSTDIVPRKGLFVSMQNSIYQKLRT